MDMNGNSGLYVVIAAFEEAATVADVVSDLLQEYPHVIVVDDGSSDDTGARAVAAGATVLRHILNRGQGAALQTGITYSLRQGAGMVVTFDADGQHEQGDIRSLVAPIRSGEVEITLGSRFLGDAHDISWRRRVLLRGGIAFTWLSTGLWLSDTHNGMRAFSRRAAATLDVQLDRMAHASELIDQVRCCGLPFREIPVTVRYTAYSRSKGQGGTAALRIAWDYLLGKLLP